MKIKYSDGMPLISIKIKGPRGEAEVKEAYLDSGAGKTLVSEGLVLKLGLRYRADYPAVTGSGKDVFKLYEANVTFLGKSHHLYVVGRDLPEQARIRALIGRDILDRYKVCFDGKNREITVEE